jgi:hypothetical protein
MLTLEIELPDGTIVRWAREGLEDETIDLLTDEIERVIGAPDTIKL